jgi:hypothetical protein
MASEPPPCKDCGNSVPPFSHYCPHCARPALFPNVRAAQIPAEREALERRYQEARRDASSRDADADIGRFETAVASSKAVIARSFTELDRLAASDKELFPTFYRLLGEEVRLPHGNQWDVLRRIADEALFPGYKEEIRFAALSLDEAGLSSYGVCSFVLREDMIAHRASVFEENSTVFLQRNAYEPPLGHRATWEDRAKLCVAKLAGRIGPGMPETQFPSILLRTGATSAQDDFVEVHIWGPMSLRTVERILMPKPRKKAFWKALRDRLQGLDVKLEEIA